MTPENLDIDIQEYWNKESSSKGAGLVQPTTELRSESIILISCSACRVN